MKTETETSFEVPLKEKPEVKDTKELKAARAFSKLLGLPPGAAAMGWRVEKAERGADEGHPFRWGVGWREEKEDCQQRCNGAGTDDSEMAPDQARFSLSTRASERWRSPAPQACAQSVF